ncbi:hypothetical protein SMD20_05650 [Nonomuraea sp. LP-02]|uniref:hypothetical protein n=1 Tax=Nonomuraea sp. LP-02 TaxID=3097960 RepID=UPI002E304B80|nr:hypothetical protein [Nonomuraea sp. LP-02]MED7923702.1 hypothetical protein [Nonomuraea sp. LP-02]
MANALLGLAQASAGPASSITFRPVGSEAPMGLLPAYAYGFVRLATRAEVAGGEHLMPAVMPSSSAQIFAMDMTAFSRAWSCRSTSAWAALAAASACCFILGSLAGGLAAKLAAKYALPWKWNLRTR